MWVNNKLIFAFFIAVIVATSFFSYHTPVDSLEDSFSGNSAGDKAIDSSHAGLNKKELPGNGGGSLGNDSHLTPLRKSGNEEPISNFNGGWSLYLDRDSAEYKYLLDKYRKSEEKLLIDGDNAYFVEKIDEEIDFVKVTKEYRDLAKYEPLNVYSVFLEQLNDLKEYGDWSYESEVIARNIFSKYFKEGRYSINAIQCREKTCLIEFDFSDFNFANNFVNVLRANRKACQCIPAETIWPDLKKAVLKLDLI